VDLRAVCLVRAIVVCVCEVSDFCAERQGEKKFEKEIFFPQLNSPHQDDASLLFVTEN
jgi:hypothetical protein